MPHSSVACTSSRCGRVSSRLSTQSLWTRSVQLSINSCSIFTVNMALRACFANCTPVSPITFGFRHFSLPCARPPPVLPSAPPCSPTQTLSGGGATRCRRPCSQRRLSCSSTPWHCCTRWEEQDRVREPTGFPCLAPTHHALALLHQVGGAGEG